MLLVAGALNMTFYFIRLMRTDPGVDPKNVLVINVWLSPEQYPDVGKKWRFYSALLEKLAAIPGGCPCSWNHTMWFRLVI
jgi:putative ABC transport system permease protein